MRDHRPATAGAEKKRGEGEEEEEEEEEETGSIRGRNEQE